ncbi:unnamed protein product [Nesidiocoris tenuis]|uniref:Ig-like domain-containing protein n=1 Tax=Nesidiocoris tenuis TaxID=355587 RepID=A0A6H5HPT8_9HEMI|nr:unnamed protein product [Nesidiocoris tenuis]
MRFAADGVRRTAYGVRRTAYGVRRTAYGVRRTDKKFLLQIRVLKPLKLPYEVVWAERDGIAELPCDVRPARTGDRVIMVLWFKESNGIPLYR